MIIFLGLYLARVMGTKVFPKEPVPPVIKIVLFVNMRSSKEESKKVFTFGNIYIKSPAGTGGNGKIGGNAEYSKNYSRY